MFTSGSFEFQPQSADAVSFVQAPAVVPAPPIVSVVPADPAPAATPRRDEAALAEVLRHPGVWRRGTRALVPGEVQPTGFAGLDARLPGGGWPRGALTEILFEGDGIGECSLLLPALAALTAARQRVVLVGAPYLPYAPALAEAGVDPAQVVHIEAGAGDTHWTAEQCLRAGCCGAVLNWLPRTDYRQLRRLQLAASSGTALAFLFRPLSAAAETSPAALRLRLTAGRDGNPCVDILKCRGTPGTVQADRRRA